MRSFGNYKQLWPRNGAVALDYVREIPIAPGIDQWRKGLLSPSIETAASFPCKDDFRG